MTSTRIRSTTGLVAVALSLGGLAGAGRATARPVAVPPAAVRVGPASANTPIRLTLVLRPRSRALAARVRAVSDPHSPRYRHYLPVARLARDYGAPARDRVAVTRWLRRAGGRGRVDATDSFVTTTLTTGRAARLLGAPLATYRTSAGQRFAGVVRTAPLVRALRGRVRAVLGLEPPAPEATVQRPLTRPRPTRTGTPAGCRAGVATGGLTPNQLVPAYHASALHTTGVTGRGVRVALLEGDAFSQADFAQWASCFGLHAPPVRLWQVPGTTDVPGGGEPALDVDVLLAMAPRLRQIQMYQADTALADFPGLFAAPLDRRLNGGHLPQVVVRSYGGCEPAWTRQAPAGVHAVDHVLRVAAAAGVTVITSAGDRGSSDCTHSTGTVVRRPAVRFPASSPYATGVGGTAVTLDHDNRIAAASVWNDLAFGQDRATGGGVSALFRRPSWQRAPGMHGTRRAVPDVSFFADPLVGYAVYCTTQCTPSGWHASAGTSATAPLLAGGVALADQVAHAAGQRPLGLLNPLLYGLAREHPGVFRDITDGGNDLFRLGCCAARPGYDRTTGLGAVRFDAFAAAARQVVNMIDNHPR